MIPTRRWLPVALLIALVGGAGVVSLQKGIDASLESYRMEEQLLYLTSPEWVKRLAMGYDGLLACFYWTRAVQHYGSEHYKEGEFKLLHPLLDITTTLDPELLLAYRFGAIFLAEPPPGGPGRPDQAVALLQKGIKHHPDYWLFWFDLGFVYYRGLKDYQKASEAFYEGAKNPRAGPWMRVMAARIAGEGGDRQKAYSLWREVYYSTDDKAIRANAMNHMYGLRADEDIERLQALVERFERETGRPAASLHDLVSARWLPAVPIDPLGYRYQLDLERKVRLHPDSPITASALGRRK